LSNNNLKSLLFEYQQKRDRALNDCLKRKYELYEKYPDIEDIDKNIASLSIQAIQTSLITSTNNTDKNKKEIEELKLEKQDLLKKYRISNKFFLPKFECSKCEDTGYIKTASGNVLCSCIKQKLYNLAYNNSNIFDLENQNFDNFRLDLYSDKVDVEKYSLDISPRENITSIKETCQDFINNFDSPSQNNLLFSGHTGLGKTFLSTCIANELIKKGKNVLYQTAPIMLDKIIDYKFGKSNDNIVDSIYSVDLLIIDDLGTETKNNLKVTELFNIINTRLLNQNNKITKTIISTNLSLQELYDTYDERIVSRILGYYNACYFYGEDIRREMKRLVTS